MDKAIGIILIAGAIGYFVWTADRARPTPPGPTRVGNLVDASTGKEIPPSFPTEWTDSSGHYAVS